MTKEKNSTKILISVTATLQSIRNGPGCISHSRCDKSPQSSEENLRDISSQSPKSSYWASKNDRIVSFESKEM